MAKLKRFELMRGPCDGARLPVPADHEGVIVPIGTRIHFYQRSESLASGKPRKVFVHVGYASRHHRKDG